MKSITIGKLIFSKKAILTIALGAFYFGIVAGALIMHSIKTESNYNILLLFLFSIPIWIILFPVLKKEISVRN